MMDVGVGDARKKRSIVCDRIGFKVEEGSWPSIRKSGSAYSAVWRHKRRQAVTTKLGPTFLLSASAPLSLCNAG